MRGEGAKRREEKGTRGRTKNDGFVRDVRRCAAETDTGSEGSEAALFLVLFSLESSMTASACARKSHPGGWFRRRKGVQS